MTHIDVYASQTITANLFRVQTYFMPFLVYRISTVITSFSNQIMKSCSEYYTHLF